MHTQQNDLYNRDDMTADHKTLLTLGENLVSVEAYEQAQQCFEKAAVVEPDDPLPYIGLGTIAMHQQQPEQAQLAFRVACRLDPACSRAYEGLAMIAQQKSEHEKAFELFLKCLELDTNNLTAILGLFQTSVEMGSFAKIIHYLEIYLNMHPGDSSVMFTLATLYMKEDRLEQSRAMLLKVLALAPDSTDAKNLLEEIEQNTIRSPL